MFRISSNETRKKAFDIKIFFLRLYIIYDLTRSGHVSVVTIDVSINPLLISLMKQLH